MSLGDCRLHRNGDREGSQISRALKVYIYYVVLGNCRLLSPSSCQRDFTSLVREGLAIVVFSCLK